ncbi:MAG: hypothetical protein ABI852_19650, partial [Gemmatimonadaceae bacterium]
MKNNHSNSGRLSYLAAAAATALLVVAPFTSAVAQSQVAQSQARWMPFSGCWVPEENAAIGSNAVVGTMVCIAPVAGTQSADVATIVNRQVLHTDRINVTAAHVDKTIDKCPGWETAAWSADGRRLLMRSEFACGDSVKVKGSGVFSLNSDGEFVHVQGTSVGLNASARVVRYRSADVALASGTVLTDSAMVRTVPAENGFAMTSVRQATGGPVSVDAVLDLSKQVDQQVAQAWLSEFGKASKLSAKELVAMSNAGMPAELIDMMVAMSYPERFQLQARDASGSGARPTNADFRTDNRPTCAYDQYDLMYMSRFDQMNCVNRFGSMYGVYPFGYLSGWRYGYGNFGYNGYGYGNNYYGNSPIVIVTRPSGDDTPQPRGRAVKGGGYTQSSGSGPSYPKPTSSGSSSSSSSGSSSGSSTGSSSSGSSSSG